jgi:RNA polymerase sigma-70 factor, ECF subfamily
MHRKDDRLHPAVDNREALDKALALARTAWPQVTVEYEIFASYVADRVAPGMSLDDGLAKLHVQDLYLACACALGDRRALAELEQTYLRSLDGPLRAIGASPDMVEDVTQTLFGYLITPGAGGAPRIAEYSGHGALRSWLRLIAVRDAGHRIRRSRRDEPHGDDALLDALATDSDPELAHLKDRYAAELKAAFSEAMGALSARDRVLLRMQLLDHLTIDQIARLHGVHRVTAARWFAAIRQSLLTVIRQIMRERFGVETTDLHSILRLVRSRLQLSLARMLGE